MRSIKPGRGPSKQAGIAGIGATIFAVIWTIIALSMGAYIMVPFGIIFIIVTISATRYNFKNAKNQNRHSLYDIVEDEEEPDPLNQKFGIDQSDYEFDPQESNSDSIYCPHCGTKTQKTYCYCPKCGKKLPK